MIVEIKRKTPASTFVTAIQLHPHRYMCKPIHWSKTDVTCLYCRFEFMKNNSVLVCVSSKNLNSAKQYDTYHFMYKSLLMKLPFRITSSQSLLFTNPKSLYYEIAGRIMEIKSQKLQKEKGLIVKTQLGGVCSIFNLHHMLEKRPYS